MAIKITEQKNIILVRRWKYSPERKRSLPTQIYSIRRYDAPERLPTDVVEKYGITDEEQQVFIDFVINLKEDQEKDRLKYSLYFLSDNLNKAKEALMDAEIRDILTVSEYEVLSNTVNDIKKLITKNKNTLKRKESK